MAKTLIGLVILVFVSEDATRGASSVTVPLTNTERTRQGLGGLVKRL
jgi:hypothetical protein